MLNMKMKMGKGLTPPLACTGVKGMAQTGLRGPFLLPVSAVDGAPKPCRIDLRNEIRDKRLTLFYMQ